jgi:hypothetical protein
VRLVGLRQYISIGAPQLNGTPIATTSIASGSNGQTMPIVSGTVRVASVSGFPSSGSAVVATASGPVTLTYSGVAAGQLTGVNVGASGILFTGNTVTSTTWAANSQVSSYLEKQVTSPLWRFPDGNVSWHVMALPPNSQRPAFLGALPAGVTGNVTNQLPGYAFVSAKTPAILSLTSAADQASDNAYWPPNGGRPTGAPLTADLGNIHDIRFPWDSANSWHYSVDVPINPPCDVALYASVKQTNTATRTNPTPPANLSVLGPEDQFYLTYPSTAVYWRVAGSLVFSENEDRDQ